MLASGKAEAISFAFEKIVDTNTPVPGGTGTFALLGSASLDNGNVAFEGFGGGQSGIYTNTGGTLDVIADPNTPISGGRGNFGTFDGIPSIDNGNVAFLGQGVAQRGIYTDIGGKLNVVADLNTPIPGGTDEFSFFIGSPSLDNGNVAFVGTGVGQISIYTDIGGKLVKVVGTGDLLDGKEVSDFTFGQEGLSGNQIAFSAEFDDGSQGIYIATVPEPSSVLGTLAFGGFGAGWMLKHKLNKQKLVS